MATEQRLDIDAVTDPALLKGHWRRIRKQVRAPRVQLFHLAADPLEWLPFEYRLDASLTELREGVASGRYRAKPPEVVRAAKSLGLTRPLAFLTPVDMLLYRNIVARAENDLLQTMPTWSRFGRADAANSQDNREPESGWFKAWLARTGQLWAITETHEWLVETDISNFFPSVHLDAALDHLLASTRLGVDVVRLLDHMLKQFAPLPEYRVSPIGGLPQESFDCSRIIAHAFLRPVDDEFAAEGKAQRYSRYMDDIVIGVDKPKDGYAAVARAQSAFEKVGLYPNASKTRIIHRDAFAFDYMKVENDYLGVLDKKIKDGTPVDLTEFRARLRQHLKLVPQPRAWERVLRRYYTASRSLRDVTLLGHAAGHLLHYPGSARQVLDYLSTFRLTAKRVDSVREAVESMDELYEDVHLLALQYVSVAPTIRDESTRLAVCSWAKDTSDRHRLTRPRVAANAVIPLAKFGSDKDLDHLKELLAQGTAKDGGLLRRQLTVALLGAGRLSISEANELAVESDEGRVMVDFLQAMVDGENRAVNLALDAATPRERRGPRMYMIPPRPMLIAPVALGVMGHHATKRREKWAKLVAKSEGPRDLRGEARLGI